MWHQRLLEKIEEQQAVVGIVGLGYVGLPLAQAVHHGGYEVVGFDVDVSKIEMLERGESYLKHLGESLFRELNESSRFEPTSDPERLRHCDVIIICLPTPLGRYREPDLRYVCDCARMLSTLMRPGQLIVLESTTFPGTTRDILLPILSTGGLRVGEEFFAAYSPEREDPGREQMRTAAIPKIVGGVDEASTRLAMALYERVVDNPVEVSSAEVAESAKLLENIYRSVNIALVNELKLILNDLNIDIWEVIEAAKTKPFGYEAFYPGPGLGGHCIPIDPFYLSWKAKEVGRNTRFIELAGEVNSEMPNYVVGRVVSALNETSKSLRSSNIMVVGIAYKPDVDDVRESPAAEIISQLIAGGANVSFHDPHVVRFPHMRRYEIDLESVPLTPEVIAEQDLLLIVTDHREIDWMAIARHATLIVDTRNAMARCKTVHGKVVKA